MDVLKLNSISKLANPVLEGYNVTDTSENPVGILVRSFKNQMVRIILKTVGNLRPVRYISFPCLCTHCAKFVYCHSL